MSLLAFHMEKYKREAVRGLQDVVIPFSQVPGDHDPLGKGILGDEYFLARRQHGGPPFLFTAESAAGWSFQNP